MEKERIDEIVDIMLETVCTDNNRRRRTPAFSVPVRRLPYHARQGRYNSCLWWTGH